MFHWLHWLFDYIIVITWSFSPLKYSTSSQRALIQDIYMCLQPCVEARMPLGKTFARLLVWSYTGVCLHPCTAFQPVSVSLIVVCSGASTVKSSLSLCLEPDDPQELVGLTYSSQMLWALWMTQSVPLISLQSQWRGISPLLDVPSGKHSR
jgi:hypothetical protein